MDEQKDPCIIQQAEEDALYTKLQTQTLEEVQRLAGKVWTDYNVHDPGVTTGDITNHALVELDYKLGFPLTDYCVEKGGAFVPGRFGLFLPEEVYTTQPVPGGGLPQALPCPHPRIRQCEGGVRLADRRLHYQGITLPLRNEGREGGMRADKGPVPPAPQPVRIPLW